MPQGRDLTMASKARLGFVLPILFLAMVCGTALQAAVTQECCTKRESVKMSHPETNEAKTLPQAMFGAGCFWGVEATFRQIEGVTETAVGYSGGHTEDPTYRDVCSHTTGHAEVVRVTYDPEKVSYEDLLDVFWRCHDPTQFNRQGPDIGDQYRSAIFYFDKEQKKAAEASREKLQRSDRYRKREIVTEITPASTFYRAEDYHQRYLEKHSRGGCPSH